LFGSENAPLKLAGLLFLRGVQVSMTVKSAEEYRVQSRSVLQLAEKFSSPQERQTLLDIAESYQRLAQQADRLAKPKNEPQSD
jgi:hypothetical protein